jgi:lysophospholipase L1-like esterase
MTNFRPGSRVHFVGDSITSAGWTWYAVAGGFVDQINAALPLAPVPFRAATVSGRQATNSGRSAVSSSLQYIPLSVTASGVAGNKVADILADVPGRITNYNPEIVVLEVGINDAMVGGTIPDFRVSYDALLDAVITWNSAVKILCISAWMNGETWVSNPLRWAGLGANNRIDAVNAEIAASCTARSANCTYADIRSPTLIYESLHNTPEPGVVFGVLADAPDGVHPNTTGKIQMGTYAFAYVTVST